MWIPEDAEDVLKTCEDCGDEFTTNDEDKMCCDACRALSRAYQPHSDRSEDYMRGEFGGF